MNKRERILAGSVLALAALWGGYKGLGRYRVAIAARRAEVQNASSRLTAAQLEVAQGRNAMQRMAKLQERSLPSRDRDKAQSLYKAWLLTKAKNSGLTVDKIELAARTTASPSFTAIGYKLDASGSLTSIVSMLYEFYRSPQLHQITRMQLLRPEGSQQLKLTLEVEALCLPGATSENDLPEGDSKRLKLASAADYQKNLVERDIVTAYSPPRPASPPAPSQNNASPAKLDDSELAQFTGTVGNGSGFQAWINVWPSGEVVRVMTGDAVKIGALEGKIERIEPRSLVLKTGDKRFLVRVGEYLKKGQELDADGNVKPVPPPEPPKT